MKYFKVIITYQVITTGSNTTQLDQILYCCAPENYFKTDTVLELFDALNEPDKKFIRAHWSEIMEADIPADNGKHGIVKKNKQQEGNIVLRSFRRKTSLPRYAEIAHQL